MAIQAPANVPKPVVAKPTGQVRVTRTTVRGLSVRQWVLTTIVGTLGFILVVGFPSACIYAAVRFKQECPADPRIPAFLGGFGALLIFRIFLYVLELCVIRRWRTFSFWPDMLQMLTVVATIFIYLTACLGLIWVVMQAWPEFKDTKDPHYCHPTIYLLAFVTFVDVIFGTFYWCICFCCFFPDRTVEIETIYIQNDAQRSIAPAPKAQVARPNPV